MGESGETEKVERIDLHVYFHWPEQPLQVQVVPNPRRASWLAMTVTKEPKMGANFTVDTTDGAVVFQFTDDHEDNAAGPNDSVTGAPIVPSATSDNPAVLTVGDAIAGATPGLWSAPLTMVAEGTANLAPVPLENSDGSAVDDAAGQPFGEGGSTEVTVSAGAAAELTMSVTG